MKVTDLSQLAVRVVEFSCINPTTGDVVTFDVRELSPKEINDILYLEDSPKPPQDKKDPFYKDPLSGRVRENFDYEDKDYKKAAAEFNNRFIYRWLIAAAQFDIPGETVDDKMKNLAISLPQWVFAAVTEKVQELNGTRESDIALAKKKLLTTPAEELNSKPL